MDWVIGSLIAAMVLLACGLVYFAFRIWREEQDSWTKRTGVDFRPIIGFARQDGFQSVALLLTNKSDEFVWTEEIEIALTELEAAEQTSEATCREIHKISQSVHPRDMLPVSLVETIYKAAGGPQREYSCMMSSVVRYRVGEKWFEEPMKIYHLRMAGLTVSGIRRERKAGYKFAPKNMSGDLQSVDTISR